MSLSYNPKRARVQPEPVAEPPKKSYEEEFPALSTSTTASIKVWGGTKKFADLAKQLEEKKQEESLKKQIETTVKKSHTLTDHYVMDVRLPHFNVVSNFTDEEVPAPPLEKVDEDEWTTVSHYKKRKQKSIEEIANRPITPPDEPETNWDDAEFNEDTQWEKH